MVLPRSGFATKGIVPFNLIKHDLIKSVSFSDWIKDFPDENILNAKVTSAADFFLSLRWRIISRPLVWLHIINLGNDRQSEGIHGNPRKIGFPRSCSDIFCIHNISSTKSIANQSLLITAILSCHWQREVAVRDKTNGCIGDQFPTGSAGYCVVTKGASPQKAREALRDKTKSCCTGLTCQHNNAKSWSCY